MCKFKSAIVMRNGDILEAPETDSHEDLIAAYGLNDTGGELVSRGWVRVEFTPPEDFVGVEREELWTLRLDEDGAPPWWEEARESVRQSLWSLVRRSMISDARKCVLGGAWMILKGGTLRKAVGARILFVERGANLGGADLRSANLGGANLGGANLGGADLRSAYLEGAYLVGAYLVGANLRSANLGGANLGGANLRSANLGGACRLSSDASVAGWGLVDGALRREEGVK